VKKKDFISILFTLKSFSKTLLLLGATYLRRRRGQDYRVSMLASLRTSKVFEFNATAFPEGRFRSEVDTSHSSTLTPQKVFFLMGKGRREGLYSPSIGARLSSRIYPLPRAALGRKRPSRKQERAPLGFPLVFSSARPGSEEEGNR
jgi:hypothetical protein